MINIKNAIKVSVNIFIFILILSLQIAVINNFSIFGIKPNIIVIYLMMLAIKKGVYKTAFISLIVGIVFDFIYGNNGMFTIIYTVFSVITSFLYEQFFESKNALKDLFAISGVIIFEFIELLYYFISYKYTISFFYLLKHFFITILVNYILIKIIFVIMDAINEKMDLKFKQHVRGL